jgi:phosphoglycerate dehydrogenase-like enzyme
MVKNTTYLIWLQWPEKCFRVNASDLKYLCSLLPEGSQIIHARSERSFLKHLPSATHAIVWNFKSEWFKLAPNLRLLATPAAGRELLPEKAPSGVKLHFGHFHGPIIAESVVGFILGWARGFFAVQKCQDKWPRTWLSDRCFDVAGTKAVVVGYGNVGKAIGSKLRTLGVEVTGITRHGIFANGRKVSSSSGRDSAVLSSADWCILALPSTTGTDDWVDESLLRKLPRHCVLINVGRGNAVNEVSLYKALKTRRIAGAYLDVRRMEPSATVLNVPGFVGELDDLDNCVVMPHSSAFSPRYLKECFTELFNDGCLY